jgi:23S rRNA (cytosine1962-C5)-methyltransferase
MAPQWAWMRGHLGDGTEALNLFGYTGVGTLAMAGAGARMVHVDASKKSVEAGKANAARSGMADRPIRWLVEDAAKFTAREVRRGRRYDGIILDPPKFGRGPTGEVWRLEEHLPALVADCAKLLDADSRFLVLTVYAVRMSALAIGELLSQATAHLGGRVECGDMAVREKPVASSSPPPSSPAGAGSRNGSREGEGAKRSRPRAAPCSPFSRRRASASG